MTSLLNWHYSVPANSRFTHLRAVLNSDVLRLDRQTVQAGLKCSSPAVVPPSNGVLYPARPYFSNIQGKNG